MRIHAVGFNGRYYQDLGQAFSKMMNGIEYDMSKISPMVEMELRAYIKRAANNVTDKFTPYSPGPNTGDRLQNRSGDAKSQLRSRQSVVKTNSAKFNFNYQGSIKGPGYLNIQEDGGTIVASSGYIAIPLPDALDSRGMPLKPGPSSWKNTYIKKSRKGTIIVFTKIRRRSVPIYVLKKSVTIRPRLRMMEGLLAAAPYFERKVMSNIEKFLTHT